MYIQNKKNELKNYILGLIFMKSYSNMPHNYWAVIVVIAADTEEIAGKRYLAGSYRVSVKH